MSFKTAYLKLTLFYVLIVMVISIGFSVVIFRLSADEIERGLGRQSRIFVGMRGANNPMIMDLDQIRQDQIEESNHNLQTNLLYFNILILILSFSISYILAQKTLKPIEEAVENQNRFTADASHELRTPLTAMKTETEVALRDNNLKIDDARNILKSNLEEINKLVSLSSALLKLAKLDRDIKAEFKKISLKKAIDDAMDKVKKLANKKAIKIVFDETVVISPIILGDKDSLVELFIILFDNAIKYSPERSKIIVEISQSNKEIRIIISDQGVGIRESDLPHIFDRFYRADFSRSKEKVDGYGLGLSIAKRIVDIHHGSILAKSDGEHGSEFIVRFPLKH